MAPNVLTASIKPDVYENKGVIYNTPGIPAEEAWEEYEKKRIADEAIAAANKKKNTYGGWCVAWAKKQVGVYGTWGDGGRKLPLNSGPVVGAVVIFNYIHVAVILIETETHIFITESNYAGKNIVSTRWIAKNDTSIRGYHDFSK